MLSLENVKCTKPSEMYGDMHVCPEGFYFLAFKEPDSRAELLYAFFGLSGIYFAYRAQKKRKAEMAQWRTEHAGRYLDELSSSRRVRGRLKHNRLKLSNRDLPLPAW